MKLNLKRTRPKLTSSLALKDEGAATHNTSFDADTTEPQQLSAITPHVWFAVAYKGGFLAEETLKKQTDFPTQPSKDTILSELLATASTWTDDDEMDYTAVPVFGDGLVIEATDDRMEPKNTCHHEPSKNTEKQNIETKNKKLPPPPAANPWTRSTAPPLSAVLSKQGKRAEHLQYAGFDKSGKLHQHVNEWESKNKQDLNSHSIPCPTKLNLDGFATTFFEKELSNATPGDWYVDSFDTSASCENGRQQQQPQSQSIQDFRQQQSHSEVDSTCHPEQSTWRGSAPPVLYPLDCLPHNERPENFAATQLSEKFYDHQQRQYHQNYDHEAHFQRDRGNSRSFDRESGSRVQNPQQSSIAHNTESIRHETWRKNQQQQQHSTVISLSAPPKRSVVALVQHLPQSDSHQSIQALGTSMSAPVAAPASEEKEELSWRRRDSIPPRPDVQPKSEISNQSKQSLSTPSPKQLTSHMKPSSSTAMTASVTEDIPVVQKKSPAKEQLPSAVTDHAWRKDTGSLDRKQASSAVPTLILKNENNVHPLTSSPQSSNAQGGKRAARFTPAVKPAPASTSSATSTILKKSPLLEPSKLSTTPADASSINSSKSNTAVSTPRFTAAKESTSSSEPGQKLFIPQQQQQKGSVSLNISDFDAVMNNIKLMMSKGSGEGGVVGAVGEVDGSDMVDQSLVAFDGGGVISIVVAAERVFGKSDGEAKAVEHFKSLLVAKSEVVAVSQEQDKKEAGVPAVTAKPSTPTNTPSVISKAPQLQPTQPIQQPTRQTQQAQQIVQPSRQPYSQQQLQQQHYFQQQHLYQQQQQQEQRKLPQGSLVYPLPPQLWNSRQLPTHPMVMLGGPQIYNSYPPGWIPQQQGGGGCQLQSQGHPWAVPFLLPVASPTARFYQK
ncbi:UNVERIFIED_CONTAM: hypothetical protein HDU68_010649 [Siphonaria sp. JEL0065]|nr:hypothetical protein HDU68_010649 [Siphonaria sp. JEL0065]